MKVVVDRDLCESNARCMEIAPQVFQVDDDDVLHIVMEHPPEDLRALVEQAVARCPKTALSILED